MSEFKLSRDVLLRIIRGIGKNAGIESTRNAVCALDNNSMLICIQEFIIEEEAPNGVHQLTSAVSQHLRGRRLACQRTEPIVKYVW